MPDINSDMDLEVNGDNSPSEVFSPSTLQEMGGSTPEEHYLPIEGNQRELDYPRESEEFDLESRQGSAEVPESQEYEPVSGKKISSIEPPSYWDGKTKKYFNSLSPKGKRVWLESFKKAENSYLKQLDELAQDYGSAAEAASPLVPYLQQIEALGITPRQYVSYLIEIDRDITTDPVDTVLKIMIKQNITFEELQAALAGFTNRTKIKSSIEPLRAEIDSLKQQLMSNNVQSQENSAQESVERFFSQVDRNGNLKYPYAKELMPIMSGLSNSTGIMDLDKLYNMALNSVTATQRQEYESPEQRGFRIKKTGSVPERQAAFKKTDFDMANDRKREKAMLDRVLNNVLAKYGVRNVEY
jgi:hypothetical protein